VTDVHALTARVVDEFGIFFVDGVVGEMDILFAQIVAVGRHVRLSCKPGQSLLVDVEAQGTDSAQQDIDSEVELESLNEEWTRNVLLHNVVLACLYLFYLLGQKDASALAVRLWLHDECLLLANELLPQLAVLCGEQPGLGKEVVVLWGTFVHVHEAEPEKVLAGENVNAGEVADLLEEVKADKQVGLDMVIRPQNVPRNGALLAADHPPPQLFCHLLDHVVVGY
jgi:hypothetical protein